MVNTIPEKPAAKIYLEGLFVFCFNSERRRGEIGVYEFTDEHTFSISVIKRKHKTDEIIGEVIEVKPPRNTPHARDISIAVKKTQADLDIYRNDELEDSLFATDPADAGTFDPEDEKTKRDFRWVIDLEGPRFHNRKLDITPGTLERKISVLNGVVSVQEIAPRTVKQAFPKAAKTHLNRERCYVAFQIAIDIVSNDKPIVISYGDDHSDTTTKISLMPDDDYYYAIYLNNNCQQLNPNKHFSDFQHYYNVFAEVLPSDRYDFEAYADGTGDRYTPCDLIYLGQHDELS